MRNQMKLLATLAVLASAAFVMAQEAPPPMNGSGPEGHRPPPPPIIGALDANHDGVIDANEIANAGKALQSLDQNGDGELTPDEVHPHPPGRPGPGGPGMGGPRPDGPPPQE